MSKLGSFVMLRAGEKRADFDCGCKFVRGIHAVFEFCAVHEAAPDLLAERDALRTRNAELLAALEPLVASETLPHKEYEAMYVGYSRILKHGLDEACRLAHREHVEAALAAIEKGEAK